MGRRAAAATKRINVFATVHVPLLHPLVAAKQMATVDHIGQGRFGINVVCGWNDDEFAMFGMSKLEHDDRYTQGREWWDIVTGVWQGRTFDYDGTHYKLHGAEGLPTPWGGKAPLMMNAGGSVPGRQFAIDLSDMHFDAVRTPDEDVVRVAETKRLAREDGRTLQVWTPIGVVCRPTQREAEDFTAHIIEHADLGAVGNLAMHRRDAKDLVDNVSAFAFSGGRGAPRPGGRQLLRHRRRRPGGFESPPARRRLRRPGGATSLTTWTSSLLRAEAGGWSLWACAQGNSFPTPGVYGLPSLSLWERELTGIVAISSGFGSRTRSPLLRRVGRRRPPSLENSSYREPC